jgi:hypothetical protein
VQRTARLARAIAALPVDRAIEISSYWRDMRLLFGLGVQAPACCAIRDRGRDALGPGNGGKV